MRRVSLRTAVFAVCSSLVVVPLAACREGPTPPPKTEVATHPEGTLFGTTSVGSRPYGLAISSAGLIYVARLDAEQLSRGQLPGTTMMTGPGVGSIPSHVTFNPTGTRAYVANQGSADVSVIDVATHTEIGFIPMPSDAWNVLVSKDGARLYATTNQGVLAVINTATNAVITGLTLQAGDALRGIFEDAPRSMLYVAGRNSGNVYVVDTRTNAVARTISLGGTLQRIAVSPDGAELYVANESRGLDIVTLSTGAFRTVPLGGGGYGLAMSPDAAQLYVTVPDAGVVRIIARATGTITSTLTLGGRPRNVAFSARGDYAVVSNETGSVVFVR